MQEDFKKKTHATDFIQTHTSSSILQYVFLHLSCKIAFLSGVGKNNKSNHRKFQTGQVLLVFLKDFSNVSLTEKMV